MVEPAVQSARVTTQRLTIRPVVESDRTVFVRLFSDPGFMVYSVPGALDEHAANARFDHMVELSRTLSFAKRALIEKTTGAVIGYAGADYCRFRGQQRLEFGYRLVERARGLGYATEASRALLASARADPQGELLAIIDPSNLPSKGVATKIGFRYSETVELMGGPTELWTFSSRTCTGWIP